MPVLYSEKGISFLLLHYMHNSQQDRGDGFKIMRRMADIFQGLECKEQRLSLLMYHVGKPSKLAAGRTVH